MSYLGGVIAGALGAILWAAISYYGNVEIGWLAWGIGAAVGVAVSVGTKGGGLFPALIAVLITTLSLCGGKYLAVRMAFSEIEEAVATVSFDFTDEDCVSAIANESVTEKISAGEYVVFKNGKSIDDAEGLEDYPADIVKSAQLTWDKKSPIEQSDYKAAREEEFSEMMSAFKADIMHQGFMASFSGMDIVFFLLGIASAGKIAFSDED